MRCLLLFPFALVSLPWLVASEAQVPAAEVLAPLVDHSTFLVARANLKELRAEGLARFVAATGLAQGEKDLAALRQALAPLDQFREPLVQAGGRQAFLLTRFDPSKTPRGPGLPFVDLVLAVQTEPTADAAKLKAALQPLLGNFGDAFAESATKNGLLVFGSKGLPERLTGAGVARPELAAAFKLHDEAAAQVIFMISDDQRRVAAEMLPQLPAELGGGSSRVLTEGCRWASLGLYLDRPRVQLTVQSADAAAAQAAHGWLKSRFDQFAAEPMVKKAMPSLPAAVNILLPKVEGDQLRLELRPDDAVLRTLTAEFRKQVAATATSTLSASHMRQILIAMHNFHNDFDKLPTQAIMDKNGKPLLSWRVAILPYIEQDALYKQFKLDEPWDSPHNKSLLARMPKLYQRPTPADSPILSLFGQEAKPTSQAKPEEVYRTGYQVPLMPGSVFAEPKALTLGRLSTGDGTSNTIVLVEVDDAHGVPWTKPDDWQVNEREGARALHAWEDGTTNVAFGDASVRRMKRDVSFKLLKQLIGWNDGLAEDTAPAFGGGDRN